MTNAGDKGTLIGILDIHGKEIANGDRIRVKHVNYKDTKREEVVKEFVAEVFYDSAIAAFLYMREEFSSEDEDPTHHFNPTNSRYEILEEEEENGR
jgi:hypothetical protein